MNGLLNPANPASPLNPINPISPLNPTRSHHHHHTDTAATLAAVQDSVVATFDGIDLAVACGGSFIIGILVCVIFFLFKKG